MPGYEEEMIERIQYLDGLRGIAAFTVFLGHFFPLFFVSVAPLLTLSYTMRDFSVCLFFVLSGYVLTAPVFIKKDSMVAISGMFRRYFRLVIPIAFMLGIVFIFIHPQDLIGMLYQTFYGVFFQGQYEWFTNGSEYTGALWTISIEFIGSMIVFLVSGIWGQSKYRWPIYSGLLILFSGSYYLAFILGMILSDAYNSDLKNNLRFNNIIYLELISAGVILTGFYPTATITAGMFRGMTVLANNLMVCNVNILGVGNMGSAEFIHILGAFFLLLLSLNLGTLKNVLSTTIPVFLGKISFSLYLIHMIVILQFSVIVQQIFSGNSIIALALTIPVLFGVSYLMWEYIDQTGISLSKKLYGFVAGIIKIHPSLFYSFPKL
jgi:peptidoglycan/LPS O-acetylase OafA/YrhL